MRWDRYIRAAGTLVAVMVLAACGSGTGVTTSGTGSLEPAVESNADTGHAIEGITVPLAPAADAVGSVDSGPLTVVQYIVPLDQQQATIAFYDDWTASQPDNYTRLESEQGGVSWQNDPGPGGEKHIIAVLSPLDGDDFVTVTVTAGSLE